jgi:hypothetical protein
MIDRSTIFQKKPDVECVMLDDGAMLKFEANIHMLNQTGSEIYGLCDGIRTLGELIETMVSGYPGEEIADQVEEYLLELIKAGLVVERS